MAREKPTAPTPASIIAEQNQLLPAGMQEGAQKKMFDEQRARATGRQEAYEKSKPSGLDDLIRVFGQSAQYKGGTGIGPAYTSMQQQRRAEDMAMQKQQDELLTAIEGRQVAADDKIFGARKDSMSAANKSFQDRLIANTKALADLAGVDQRRMDDALQRLNQVEVEKMRSATQNRSLNEKLKFEADFLGMKAKARQLAESGDTAGAAKLEAQASDMLSIRGGGAGASVDRGPSPTDRLRAAQTMLQNASSEEEAALAKREITSIMAGSKAAGDGKAVGTPLPPNASAKNLTVGTVYQTAKGPAKWTGTGFMPI